MLEMLIEGVIITISRVEYGAEVVVGRTPLPVPKPCFVVGVSEWKGGLVWRWMCQRCFTYNCVSDGFGTIIREEDIPID